MTFFLLYKTRKEKYELIHAHALLPAIPAKIVHFFCGVPVVYTVHGTMCMDAKRKDFSYYTEQFLVCKLSYDLEISVSKKILSYKNCNKNIKIIANGVDLEKISRIKNVEKFAKRTFLTVGRMDRQKNHQIIISAILEIGADFMRENNIQFVRVGDGLEYYNLTVLIQKQGLEDIILLLGKCDYEETIMLYKQSHIFLLPSLSEGNPLTIAEAFACGLPVLATNVGDNATFIKNDMNGELFESGNVTNLVSLLKKYSCFELTKLTEFGAVGKELIQGYSREKCVAKTVACYEELVG